MQRGESLMNNSELKGIWMTSRQEYRWLPIAFMAYAMGIVILMFFIPVDDNLKMQLLIFMTVAYIAAVCNLAARALQRIEALMEKL
jgi:hypothetical protein